MHTRTLTDGQGDTLVYVYAHEDDLESDAREAATEALIAALEIPTAAQYLHGDRLADGEWAIAYRAQPIRFEEDGPALRGATQPSLFRAA